MKRTDYKPAEVWTAAGIFIIHTHFELLDGFKVVVHQELSQPVRILAVHDHWRPPKLRKLPIVTLAVNRQEHKGAIGSIR